MQKPLDLDAEKLKTLRLLYPIFKNEVFARREQMMRISALATGFLILLLAVLLYFNSTSSFLAGSAWAFAAGVAVFTGLCIHHMKQHSRRHAQAKRAVIDIEEALRLFEPGQYLADRGLYPDHWKIRPPRDPSLLLYSAALVLVALAVIALLLVSV